ncbi:MAG: type II secretion system F family protein [Candidatus Peregrinibacteria bacterium]
MSTTKLHIGVNSPLEPVAKTAETLAGPEPKTIIERINGYLADLTPVKTADKVNFFRLLATMINAGISIVKALDILEDQMENVHFKKIIADIKDTIETGGSFSMALKQHGRYFTEAQIGMVEAGEASGRLNQTLLQIAEEAEKSATLIAKVRGAMIYPIVVIIVLLVASFAVLTYVIPRIKEMFESLGGELPFMTLALIKISDILVGTTFGIANALWILILLIALIMGILGWKRTPAGRFWLAKIVFYLPVFGELSRKVALARFCRGLSTLVGSGVSIIKALRIAGAGVGNAVYEKRINQIADDVKQGITMGENMKDDEFYFPSMVVGMFSVAEQTAQIDTITGKLADYYENRVDETIKNISSLMEPIIIVILGGAVAFLVLSVMLPILQSSDLATSAV